MTRAHRDRFDHLLAQHQRLHDPLREPRNRLRWLGPLRQWQAGRLERSFRHFLLDPQRAPATAFFLGEVYGDRDFSRRDADIARVVPKMQRLLPERLLTAVGDAIELGALTHALDLDTAQALHALAPRGRRLDVPLYGEAYRLAGRSDDRARQIELIGRVGRGLGDALQSGGVSKLLVFARGPARLAGLNRLQGFLERGHAAFRALDDPVQFVAGIERDERLVAERLFASDPDPFRFGD